MLHVELVVGAPAMSLFYDSIALLIEPERVGDGTGWKWVVDIGLHRAVMVSGRPGAGLAWRCVIDAWIDYGKLCRKWFWTTKRAYACARRQYSIQRYTLADKEPLKALYG